MQEADFTNETYTLSYPCNLFHFLICSLSTGPLLSSAPIAIVKMKIVSMHRLHYNMEEYDAQLDGECVRFQEVYASVTSAKDRNHVGPITALGLYISKGKTCIAANRHLL